MHLLVFLDWFAPIGGVESFVWRLIHKLDPKIRITLLVCPIGGTLDLRARRPNLKIVNLNQFKRPLAELPVFDELGPPFLIWANSLALDTGRAARSLATQVQVPLIVTHHTVPEYQNCWFWRLRRRTFWEYYRWFDREATAVVCPTKTVAQLVTYQHVFDRPHVISNGVDTELYAPGCRLCSPDGQVESVRPTLLFVGRVATEKNLELLFEAMALQPADKRWQLNIIGPDCSDSRYGHRLRNLIVQLGLAKEVKWLGYHQHDSPELVARLRQADYLVVPSKFETQSLVALEALACGTPVIASYSGALPELVTDGRNGYLFRCGEVADLARVLAEAYEVGFATRHELSAEAVKTTEPHQLTKTVEAYEKLFADVLHHRLA